ncbi:MAG: LytTR family DNA-binding domain-containing protein [Bacilli bacterium]
MNHNYALAICDDSKEAVQQIVESIHYYKSVFTIHTYTNPQELLMDFKISQQFDVVFLDIDMPNLDGFQLAERIKLINNSVIIVFVTIKKELILQSFKYRPISFVYKKSKIDFKLLFRDLKVELSLLHPTFEYIKNNVQYQIKYSDIVYFKKDLNDLYIHTISSVFVLRMTIKELKKIIVLNNFIRVNKSVIVNTNFIKNVDHTNLIIELTTNESIKFSRLYKKTLKDI